MTLLTSFLVLHRLVLANFLGMLVFGVTWWQWAQAPTKTAFLVSNVASCVLIALAYSLAGSRAGAEVSLLAAATSLTQCLSRPRPGVRIGIAVIGIVACWFFLPPQRTLFGVLPFAVFTLNRIAETRDHLTMRLIFLVSPLMWIVIALHVQAWTLVPSDVWALVMGMIWVRRHMTEAPGCVPEPAPPDAEVPLLVAD